MTVQGIRTSNRPLGPLAKRWLSALKVTDERMQGRMRRGRTLAKAGRVHSLDFAPGTVYATVEDGSCEHRPTIRIRTYDEEEWRAVLDALRGRLDRLAALVEGNITVEFLKDLQRTHGVRLFPRPNELDGDCDCGDYAVPCAHGAAVHHLVAEALEGEPLLLFALRGRPREQLLAELRRSWGDTSRAPTQGVGRDETPPPGDWFASPHELPRLTFSFNQRKRSPGLLELGPLPGNGDLLKTFAPLYEAGSAAAHELALAEPTRPARRRRMAPARAPSAPVVLQTPNLPPPTARREADAGDLGERLVNLLADAEDGASTKQLANCLDLDPILVRRELVELETLGVVARTGTTRATRWWLG